MQCIVLHHSQKSVTSHRRFLKKGRTDNFVSIKTRHTLTFSESCLCSVIWGFSLPHTWKLCLLTVPCTWSVDSSERQSVKIGLILFNAGNLWGGSWESYHNNKLAYILMSPFILEIKYFILLPFKARHLVCVCVCVCVIELDGRIIMKSEWVKI